MQQPSSRRLSSQRSPTVGLLFGLAITLAAVVAYSTYITVQLSGLRKLQSDIVDRNRRVGMRERAELIGGTLELLQPELGGMLVRLGGAAGESRGA